jgi:hypothetical protein
MAKTMKRTFRAALRWRLGPRPAKVHQHWNPFRYRLFLGIACSGWWFCWG